MGSRGRDGRKFRCSTLGEVTLRLSCGLRIIHAARGAVVGMICSSGHDVPSHADSMAIKYVFLYVQRWCKRWNCMDEVKSPRLPGNSLTQDEVADQAAGLGTTQGPVSVVLQEIPPYSLPSPNTTTTTPHSRTSDPSLRISDRLSDPLATLYRRPGRRA